MLSFMEATRTIYQTEGTKGFMRGLVPALLKSSIAAGTYFSMLYYFEERIKQMQIMKDATNHFVSSSLARTF